MILFFYTTPVNLLFISATSILWTRVFTFIFIFILISFRDQLQIPSNLPRHHPNKNKIALR